MSYRPNTGRRHSARFASLPEEIETEGGFEDEPLNGPSPPQQPPRPSFTQQRRYSSGPQQERRYSDGPADYSYEQQEYSLNTPYDSPEIPQHRRFSHSAAHLQQQRYEDNPASAPPAAGVGVGVIGEQNTQYDYFATTRSRGYSHARTMSGSSAAGMTPSPYEYPHNSNSPPNHGDGQGGFKAPIYDQPLPNYKPKTLRRPFLLALLFVIAGIIGGLVVGLLKLPVRKGGLVARAVHAVEGGVGSPGVLTSTNTLPNTPDTLTVNTSGPNTLSDGSINTNPTPSKTRGGGSGSTGGPSVGDFGSLSVQETVTPASTPTTTPQTADGNHGQSIPTTLINTSPVPGDGDFESLSVIETITPTLKTTMASTTSINTGPVPGDGDFGSLNGATAISVHNDGTEDTGQSNPTTSINTGPVPGDGDFESLNGVATVTVNVASAGSNNNNNNNQPQAPTITLDGGVDPTITGVPPSNNFGNLNNPLAITTRPAVTGGDFENLNGADPTPTTGSGAEPPGAFGNLNDGGTSSVVVPSNQALSHTPIAPGDPPPQAFGALNHEETVTLTGMGDVQPSGTAGGVGSAQQTAFGSLNEDDSNISPLDMGDQNQAPAPTHTRPTGVTGNPPPSAFAELNDNEPSGTPTSDDGDTHTPTQGTTTLVDPPPSHTTQQIPSSDLEDPFSGPSTTVPYVQSSDFGNLDDHTTTVGAVPPTDFNDLEPSPTPDHGNNPPITPTVAQSNFGILNPTDTIRPSGTGPRPVITYGTANVLTLTNAAGSPTLTSTIPPQVILTPHTTTMTNAQGQATTMTTNSPIPPSTHVLTNAAGTPTKTVIDYPMLPASANPGPGAPPGESFVVISSSTTVASYILGMFVPTVVAIVLSIPIRNLDANARVFHPWHQLSRPQGSLGRRSICLEPFGWNGYLEVFRVLGSGQWLLLATTILTIFSAVLVPLSAEAIRIDLQGPNCKPGTMTNKGCFFITTAFMTPTLVCVGILGAMALILLVLSITMGRWKTGVACNPWSLASIASLSLNEEVRRLFAALPTGIDASDKASEHVLESVLQDRRFRLGYFYGKDSGFIEYGIVLADRDRESISEKNAVAGHGEEVDEYYNDYLLQKFDSQPQFKYNQHHQEPIQELDSKRHLPFLMLGFWGRGLLLFVLLGMIALIGYYTATGGNTDFEKFMSGEGFGVRFLFTGVGVVIVFAWASFFDSIAIISPFRLEAHHPRLAEKSILLAPPRNAFSGLWAGLQRGDLLLALTSFIAILTEFLPILLCNTPFRSTQLYIINRACTYGSLGILGAMSLVLMGSFAVKWPHMPLDPSTVSGMMYYVADSWMLNGFEGGVSKLSRKERALRIKGLRRSYAFGRGVGVSGRTRVQVDWADEAREPVYV